MNKGTLAFSMDGENMGVAVNNTQLTKGPIYPAVTLFNADGC